ncbi:hypothetical protein L9H26_19230 [Morganella psychrotolerans]|uniref:Uncharacterized protein n=1 Tax=Morganella psychrotolerans TaxID=368603 RepID=A0A5M9QWW2_9GAMM|nr:hypothetical protein [Morganella psychrotolerans]KAA8713033.1 hypothetical protein F4V73_18130 [Morganella psychrotolerans]
MAIGAFIKGESGVFQVDGENQAINLKNVQRIKLKGGDLKAGTSGKQGYYTEFPTKAHKDTSLIAVDSPTWVRVGGLSSYKENRNGRLSQPLWVDAGDCICYEFGGGGFDWHKSKYGMSIRNKDGIEVFNTNWEMMKILDQFFLSPVENFNYQIPPGKKVAAFMGGGLQGQWGDGAFSSYSCYFMRRNGQTIEFRYKDATIQSGPWEGNELLYYPLFIIIIDVTDYPVP